MISEELLEECLQILQDEALDEAPVEEREREIHFALPIMPGTRIRLSISAATRLTASAEMK